MGVGQKIKEVLVPNDGVFDRKEDNNRAPGSFPVDDSYVAPQGTHVGRQSEFESEEAATGRDHNSRFTEHGLDGGTTMGTADRQQHSNIMEHTGASRDHTSRTSGDYGDHRNKLHKRNDPRRYEDGNAGVDRGEAMGSGGLHSDNIRAEQRHEFDPDSATYDRATSRTHDDNSGIASTFTPKSYEQNVGRNIDRNNQDISGSQTSQPRSANVGYSAYGTVTGTHRQEERERHNYQEEIAPAHGTDRHHEYGHPSSEGGTGARDMAYRSKDATNTPVARGTASQAYEDQPRTSDSAFTSSRAAGISGNTVGSSHHGQQYRDNKATEHSSLAQPSHIQGQRSYDIQNPDRSSTGASMGYGGAGPDETIRSQAREQQRTGTVGSLGSGAPTSSGAGRTHYGPGYPGAKVLHKCQHCGHDDDISHYFNSQAIYRLG